MKTKALEEVTLDEEMDESLASATPTVKVSKTERVKVAEMEIVAEMELETLELVASDEGRAESVWHEMIEASTEAAIMLYIAPPEMSEDELPEVVQVIVEQPIDKEYEIEEEEDDHSRFGEYQLEQGEEKNPYERSYERKYERESEKREEQNGNGEGAEGYEK